MNRHRIPTLGAKLAEERAREVVRTPGNADERKSLLRQEIVDPLLSRHFGLQPPELRYSRFRRLRLQHDIVWVVADRAPYDPRRRVSLAEGARLRIVKVIGDDALVLIEVRLEIIQRSEEHT